MVRRDLTQPKDFVSASNKHDEAGEADQTVQQDQCTLLPHIDRNSNQTTTTKKKTMRNRGGTGVSQTIQI